MNDLVARSLQIIAAGQAPSGAYVACPAYPTYRYCWFRDGTFIADAMARWGRHADAARFYDWAAHAVLAREDAVARCVATMAAGRRPDAADLLHTRYTLDGRPGSDDWPNFQLDGFGTLLWGIARALEQWGADPPAQEPHTRWRRATRLVVRYVAALWQEPNSDCWEEFPDRIAVSTLAALHAGLHAAAGVLDTTDETAALAAATAVKVRILALERGTRAGHLIKQIDGADEVDASLLWASVPFGAHGLLAPDEPLMRGTAARIVADLTGATGGIHRYRADTFYGGGEWLLLTALLGHYYLAIGDRAAADRCRAFVVRHADTEGRLPEQSSAAPLAPAYVAEWVERWGPVARPLLWSHAACLDLCAALSLAPTQSA